MVSSLEYRCHFSCFPGQREGVKLKGSINNSLAVKCKSEENCAFDDKSTIFGTEIIEILRNIF